MIITAKKHLGQNFLKNTNILNTIVGESSLAGKNIIEIGPGLGDLTQCLLDKNPSSLSVIEIDGDMIPLLEERFGSNIHIYHTDVLKVNIVEEEDVQKTSQNIYMASPYHVYGNIPYYITSPILMHFLYSTSLSPETFTVTMQKEVADRILSRDKKESVLSLACKLRSTIVKVCDINPHNFNPVPKVWSTCLRFENIWMGGSKEGSQRTLKIIKIGFSQKRKKLISNLTHSGYSKDKIENIFQQIGIIEGVRAEDLTLEQWKLLGDDLL